MVTVKPLTVHWHQDSAPIYSADFQPGEAILPANRSARFATAGGDNNVRVWRLKASAEPADPPQVEYLATLAKHEGAVNAVRFNRQGTVLASAGDDGVVCLWAPTPARPGEPGAGYAPVAQFGNEFEDQEGWRVVRKCRSASFGEIYDLAWSPSGRFLAATSMDKVVSILDTVEGTCVAALRDHKHYVQGVTWDPRGEYVATQSSDQTVLIYRVPAGPAKLEIGAPALRLERCDIDDKMLQFHSESFSSFFRRLAFSPDGAVLVVPAGLVKSKDEPKDESKDEIKDDTNHEIKGDTNDEIKDEIKGGPKEDIKDETKDEIKVEIKVKDEVNNVKNDGVKNAVDEAKNEPMDAVMSDAQDEKNGVKDTMNDEIMNDATDEAMNHPKDEVIDDTKDEAMNDAKDNPHSTDNPRPFHGVSGTLTSADDHKQDGVLPSPKAPTKTESPSKKEVTNCAFIYSRRDLKRPQAVLPLPKESLAVHFSPVIYELRGAAPVVDLPYRMIYAVATLSGVFVYDTEQAQPLGMAANLHYSSLTDLAWSPDGRSLLVTSIDGFCSVLRFDKDELGSPYKGAVDVVPVAAEDSPKLAEAGAPKINTLSVRKRVKPQAGPTPAAAMAPADSIDTAGAASATTATPQTSDSPTTDTLNASSSNIQPTSNGSTASSENA